MLLEQISTILEHLVSRQQKITYLEIRIISSYLRGMSNLTYILPVFLEQKIALVPLR